MAASLFKQTATEKTSVPFAGATVSCSVSWISASIVDGGLDVWVSPNDVDEARKGMVRVSYNGYSWPIEVTQAGNAAATSYSAWAEANGLDGAWNAKDANGIYNVFRYAFGVAKGNFTETPLINIAFEDGKPVIKTPPVVNAYGFTFWVASSDVVDGTENVVNYPLDASGKTMIEGNVRPTRFFRLRAELAQ